MTRHHHKSTFDEDGKQIDTVDIPFTQAEEEAADAQQIVNNHNKVQEGWDSFREERNSLLTESDWTQYNDTPLDDETKDDWITYRQELRDLPATTDDPADPTWPEAPE